MLIEAGAQGLVLLMYKINLASSTHQTLKPGEQGMLQDAPTQQAVLQQLQ